MGASLRIMIPALAAILGMSALGCSLMLAWSPEGHPCNDDGECYEAEYSCRHNTCIAHNSLPIGETCTLDRQCEVTEPRSVCATALDHKCRTTCSDFFTTSKCASGQYCWPTPIKGDSCDTTLCPSDPPGQVCRPVGGGEKYCFYYQGVCDDAVDCDRDPEASITGCDPGEVCVVIVGDVKACLVGCQVSWDPGPTYRDNCGASSGEAVYCTPVGMTDAQRLVCLDTHGAAAGRGDSCKTVSPQACKYEANGLACVNGRCALHCEQGTPAGSSYCDSLLPGTICHTQQSNMDGDEYGICGVP